MHFNYLAIAIPFFLFFIGIEYWYSKKKGKNFFHFSGSISNLNIGIAERLLDVFTIGIFYYFFDYLYKNFALFSWKPGIVSWIVLFVATDFVWYWYHRKAHEVNIFWAVHVVHHQSDDFNYTVSARITVFQAVVRCLFWSVLPIMGFPAAMISSLLLVHGLYPFFIHTRTIGKLGWLEYILVTPSHHRVHHSSNPEYLDKNYGDVLIIWDKLFGTFAKEKSEPVFGLTKPLNSYSFLWQHFHFLLEIAVAFRKARGWRARFKVLFGPPSGIDPGIRENLESRLLSANSGLQPTAIMKRYILWQTAISMVLLFLVCVFEKRMNMVQLWLISVFIIVCLINSGAMLEQRSWIFYLEYVKLSIFLIAAALYFPDGMIITVLIIIFGVLLYFFRPIRDKYMRLMFETIGT